MINSAFTMNMDQYKRNFTMFIFSDKQNRESKMSDEEYEVESILQKRTKKGKVIALHCYCLQVEPCDANFSKKCLCSHLNDTTSIKYIWQNRD